jgi:hypothetical protein
MLGLESSTWRGACVDAVTDSIAGAEAKQWKAAASAASEEKEGTFPPFLSLEGQRSMAMAGLARSASLIT